VLLNLRHAGLPGANLIDARLMGVDPAHANIRGADLSTVEDLTEESTPPGARRCPYQAARGRARTGEPAEKRPHRRPLVQWDRPP